MTDETSEAIARELAALRAEVAMLRAEQPRVHGLRVKRYGPKRARLVITALETDPEVQYKVHRWGAIYWLINFPLITWFFFAHNDIWLKWGVFITLIYSIYANLATDYGAMSSALAAKAVQGPPSAGDNKSLCLGVASPPMIRYAWVWRARQ